MPGGVPPYEREDFRRVAGEALRPGGLALTERGLAACCFAPGARVLDIGCGPGATLARLSGEGLDVVGIDPSARFAAEARTHGRTVRATGQALPFEAACLDGVFCECVLSASGDAAGCLAEIRRVLRPGGRAVLTDLYLRQGAAPAPDAFGTGGCAAGAVPRDVFEQRIAAAGLAILFFEDHTRLLTELACRLTMALGSARSVIDLITGRDTACAGAGPRPRYGYCLCVATKEAP